MKILSLFKDESVAAAEELQFAELLSDRFFFVFPPPSALILFFLSASRTLELDLKNGNSFVTHLTERLMFSEIMYKERERKKNVLYLHPERLLEDFQALSFSEPVSEGFYHQIAERWHGVVKELKNIYVYVNAAIMCIHKHKCCLFYDDISSKLTLLSFRTLFTLLPIKTYIAGTSDLHGIDEPVAADLQQETPRVLVPAQRIFQVLRVLL